MRTIHRQPRPAWKGLLAAVGLAFGMPISQAQVAVTQTLVYHQRTDLPGNHRLASMPPALSEDGSTIAFVYRLRDEGQPGGEDDYPIVATDFNGSNPREIDRYDRSNGIIMDISADGKRLVSTDTGRVRMANAQTGGAVQILNAGRVWTVRVAGNEASGYRVFMLLQQDAFDSVRQVNLQGGVYVMNEDGSNLTRLASREQLAAMLGVQDPLNFVLGVTGAQRGNMDVSEGGSRIVFAASGGTQVFGVNDDGTGLHIIQRDAPRFESLCISRDGQQVGFVQSRSPVHVYGVMSFAGGPLQDLHQAGSYSHLRFTGDGRWLQCSDTGILASTSTQKFQHFAAAGGHYPPGDVLLAGGSLFQVSMAASGQRFVYLWSDPDGVQQIATVERTGNLGGAPAITNPVVDPNFVIRPAESFSKVIADVAFGGGIYRVGHVAMLVGGERSGLVDEYVDRAVMHDNGQTGDGAAGDGTFASAFFAARVDAWGEAQLGVHTMRINAEGDDAAGIRHATSLEFAPFSVVASGAPRIDSITPNQGEGGDFVTIKGDFFDVDGHSTVHFGDETASVHGASQKELLVVVPYGIPPGPVYVTVTARGLTSNAALFNMLGCAYTVSPLEFNIPVVGSTGTVDVSATAGCEWTAQSQAGWITILSGTSGTGDGTVRYGAAANPGSQARSGTLTVAGKSVTVVQAGSGGGECTYALSADNQIIPDAGGSGSVSVLTQVGCSWTAQSLDEWISLTAGSAGSGPGMVEFVVSLNPSEDLRIGVLMVAGSEFLIYQEAAGGGLGNCQVIPIVVGQTVNGTLEVTDCFSPFFGGDYYADLYSFSASAGDQVIITQASASFTPSLLLANAVTQEILEDAIADSEARIPPLEGAFTIPEDGLYLIEASSLEELQTGAYTLSLLPGSGTVCEYTVEPTHIDAPASGQSGTVAIGAQPGCAWTAVNSAAWIELVAGTSGTGDGLLSYLIQPNPEPAARNGSISIAGQSVTITQAGAEDEPLVVEIHTAVEIRWLSKVGKTYQVYRTVGVPFDLFEPLGDPIAGTGDYISVFDTTRHEAHAFYTVETID